MAKINQSTVKIVNIHQSKIDVVKFDGINFGMWRCELMNALSAQNLEDTLFTRETSEDLREKLGQDESDNVWRHQVLFDIRHQVLCDDRDFCKKKN